MKNRFVDIGSAQDIDQRMSRVLKDLGYSSGTVNLSDMRDLLRLDISYYTADDPSLGAELVHKLKIGANQVIKKTGLLLQAIKKFNLKALFLPEKKQILIDAQLPDLKKRWSETHEIAHSLIPWHSEYTLGDTRETLSPSCHETIEAEANYGAGRLLFPKAAFLGMTSSPCNLADLKAIAGHFGNTITSTLWRYVENSDELVFGAIGEHPKYPRVGEPQIAYLVRSRKFETQFSLVNEAQIFEEIKKYCRYQKTGPLGEAEVVLCDDSGARHVFKAETFSNKYHALTLARYRHQFKTSLLINGKTPALKEFES